MNERGLEVGRIVVVRPITRTERRRARGSTLAIVFFTLLVGVFGAFCGRMVTSFCWWLVTRVVELDGSWRLAAVWLGTVAGGAWLLAWFLLGNRKRWREFARGDAEVRTYGVRGWFAHGKEGSRDVLLVLDDGSVLATKHRCSA